MTRRLKRGHTLASAIAAAARQGVDPQPTPFHGTRTCEYVWCDSHDVEVSNGALTVYTSPIDDHEPIYIQIQTCTLYDIPAWR